MQLVHKKCRYKKNLKLHKKYGQMGYLKCQQNKKGDMVKNFLQHVKQGSYYICTISHRSLYQRGVRLFKYEKYHMLTANLYPMKSFDEAV